MVFYEVYSESTRCIYKTSIWSKATIVIFIINLLTFCVPFLLAYKTQGLWLKHDYYLEQPDVHFKYKHIIILETENIEEPIICTTFPDLAEASEELNKCQQISVREDDFNKDELVDRINVQATVKIDPLLNILGVTVILIFDYKLYSHSMIQMESAGWFVEKTPFGCSELQMIGDLRLHQKHLLRHKGRDFMYNKTLLLNEDLNIFEFIKDYSDRNLTTRFENVYSYWTRGRSGDEPFVLRMTINIPQETLLYLPGFWQIIKMAWVQYLALLYVSILISRRVKHFILDNRLVHNIKILPWSKKYF